jgi:prepilin-type N-terminal cleavage/methylation domain-containing protein
MYKGFTLVEVLISIAIIAVLVSVVTLRVRTPDNITVDTLAQRVAADLERCRTLARTSGENITLDFNDSDNYYEIKDASGNIIDRYAYSSSIGDTVPDVTFTSDGSLTSSSDKTVSFDITSGGVTTSRTITVYSNSGSIVVN